MSDFLDYLRTHSEVSILRNYWRADIVVLLAPHFGGACDVTLTCVYGLAELPGYGGAPPPGAGFASMANAVVDFTKAEVDPYIFPHELGHTLGANHAPNTTVNPTPIEPYAFDHYADDGKGWDTGT